MDALHRLSQTFVGTYPADATEGQREYMTNVAFAMMALALAVCTALIFAGWLAEAFCFSSITIVLLIDLPLGAAWWLVRRGYWRQGRYVPLAEPSFAIETQGLTKHYGRRPAVVDLDLRVPRGAVFARRHDA